MFLKQIVLYPPSSQACYANARFLTGENKNEGNLFWRHAKLF